MINSDVSYSPEAIAVIGLAGRFPGADSVSQFWQNLCNSQESISFLTDEELSAAGVDETLIQHPNYVKAGALLSDVDTFDAKFFGFTPKEAELMDPQHRLLLECAWTALENAGYPPSSLTELTGVFVGANISHYLLQHLSSHAELLQSQALETLISNDKDYLATRISYLLNLKGPSFSIGTACSTSLVAVHLACRSLLGYQCDMAIAGGISIQNLRREGYLHHEGSIASPTGTCRAFDAQAQGTVFGSGMGLVVLKRLDEALTDGDHIYGVIKGSAINNDGAGKVGYTAPSVEGQAEVVAEALAIANIAPETIRYIEAHGTGTELGDPIEIKALNHVFRTSTNQKNVCAIGSVKTNVGHLNTAAGVTGLIKTLLSLKHRKIPPSLHFEQPNPHIDFANSPFYVNTQLTDWPSNGIPRRAGVSSFGIGGTNAHVVLEEAPTGEPPQPARPWQLLLLSAKTKTALDTATANLATLLQHSPHPHLADIAYTLQVGRQAFAHRRMVVCQPHDASSLLASSDPQRLLSGQTTGAHRAIAFLFPGQGSQYPGMAKELYETEPTFRAVVETCCQLLRPVLAVDLREILFPTAATHDCERLNQTRYAQPALFVVEYALAHLWMSWGIQPAALLGHSIGELVAACLAGVFCLEDALTLVVRRAELMQQCPTGAMLSVPLSAAQLQPWLGSDITLAVSNAPSLSVVSGSQGAIASLSTELAAKGVETRLLHTSHGFHSALMAPAVEPLIAAVEQVRLHPPQIPVLSNVTGTWLTAAQATDPHYWGEQLRQTVQFASCLKELVQDSSQILLEVGPGRTLTTLAKQQATAEQLVLASLRHPQQQESDIALLLQSLGRLWLEGVEIDWSGFYAHERRQRVPLPTYPFERQRYWIEPIQSSSRIADSLSRKSAVNDWFYQASWKRLPALNRRSAFIEPSCWLIFADANGLANHVAQQLEQAGQTVITVTPATEFARLNDRHYTLNPDQPEDYETLLQTVRIRHSTPQRVVYSWSLVAPETAGLEELRDFYGLIYLTQAIANQLGTATLYLDVLTHHLHDVLGTEDSAPDRAAVLGACKVIPQEYPHLTCRNLDLDLPQTELSPDHPVIQSLLAELLVSSPEATIAHRGRHRWEQTFESMPLPAEPGSSRLRQGGIYLIAGDLINGLGFAIAQLLIETWQAKVALVGQSGLPERHLWEQWLTSHSDDDRVSRRIRQIQTLETAGAQLLIFEADVTHADQMQRAIGQIDQHFGTVHGVIYTPAINAAQSARSIQELNVTNSASELRSRMQGLLVIESTLQGKSLDFYLVQSSLACVLGGLGLAAYTASYTCLDAVVSQRSRTHSTPWFSVNRQAWHSEWEAELSPMERPFVSDLAMTPTEVWEAIQQVLTMPGAGQVIVSTASLQARLEQEAQPSLLAESTVWQQWRPTASHVRPAIATPYVAPTTDVEKAIAAIWQMLLGIEPIGIHDNFFELGGHSLLAVQVISRLREQFQVELPLKSILFEAPTVTGLARVIAEQTLASGDDRLDQLLREIENLSPEDVQARLAQQSPLSR
ncbi:acyltransferase domain-containing protein [Oculatella sp. LEGE 06141]|uniref:type I polyketide synthase n=1 Tax=Oculatella sp. LEGE 06141 TaxID=1828648 RepID=UPI00188035E6|nr:type I polyketide synthase [Oculatella sp. LEGE 06141]MBE9178539.1 acyltransferase domain-containing protein [Oculatella sp. LEGE 06141]